MSARTKTVRAAVSLLAVSSILLVAVYPSGLQLDPAAHDTLPASPAPTGNGPFRTRVAVTTTYAWARLEQLGVVLLEAADDWALVLADGDQLETLARLGFQPRDTDAVDLLLAAQGAALGWVPAARSAGHAHLALSPGQADALRLLPSVDDDADGLTNTQETWWCTDPLNPDSDGDGVGDAQEVIALQAWLANETAGPPASGKPFAGWPPDHPGCYDDDHDSVPDLAERWELGLFMNHPSTDRDRYSDGMELFGLDSTGPMPSWVRPPGAHPLAAAYPEVEIDLVPSSLHLETVTVLTTDHMIAEGTEQSYSTARTQGTSTTVAETRTWNSWEESSVTTPQLLSRAGGDGPPMGRDTDGGDLLDLLFDGLQVLGAGWACLATEGSAWPACIAAAGKIGESAARWLPTLMPAGGRFDASSQLVLEDDIPIDPAQLSSPTAGCTVGPDGTLRDSCDLLEGLHLASDLELPNWGQICPAGECRFDDDGFFVWDHVEVPAEGSSEPARLVTQPVFEVSFPLYQPFPTLATRTEGRSWGGALTTSHEQYEEHTITNGEAFSSEESWGDATAVDSSHAADLWFSYVVSNSGTDYARQICDLSFNIYIGQEPHPAATYHVAPDIGGDGCFSNFEPGEEHSYSFPSSSRVALTLDQMRAVDLSGAIRVVIEDYTLGEDDYYRDDARNAGVLVAIEDGMDDGDELIDRYLIPTWGEETVLDVLARYFPHTTDADGNLVAIWTPEYRADTPSWCHEPRRVGTTLWCRHALSTADWWNIYLDGLGDGTTGLEDTPAAPGSSALFRFNSDSDLDGYSDRSEAQLATDPEDPASHPQPELLGGMHSIRTGDYVTATLSLLNTGLYDAYGVEAIMIAPDDSVSITNNTVGGSGRVRALHAVVVGSRIMPPEYEEATWRGTATPASGGYYEGTQDRNYAFVANCSNPGGCSVGSGTWSLAWDDGTGNSGTLNFGAGYASPTPLDVGALGVQVSLLSGTIHHGDTFTLAARTPRDTFQYTVNREPHTPPVVVVSYNDPQGSHRFVTAIALGHPADDLAVYSGQMLEDLGVEIATQAPVTAPGAYTTTLVLNWPAEVTLEDAHLFLEFVDTAGTVATEFPVTVTVSPGPAVVPVAWSTDAFSPTFQTGEDYIVMAFWTDWEGNILDVAARPLSSFQADPGPVFAMADADAAWDFGSAPQGAILRRTFAFANTGFLDLLTYVTAPPGMTISQQGSRRVGPADVTTYEIALNAADLPVGPYDETVVIRTSDPDSPTRTVHVTGTITAGFPDTPPAGDLRPLDWDAYIPGSHSAYEWVDFTHTLGPTPETLHPVRVYSGDYGTLWGVGRYATPFGEGTASYEMFGDGSDGDLTVSAGQTFYVDSVRTRVSSTSSAGQKNLYVASSSGFSVGDEVLVIQMDGTGAGNYEFGTIASLASGQLVLEDDLQYTFTASGSARAQVLRVPHYHNVTVQGTVAAHTWNGDTGGVLVFRASGTTTVGAGGRIDLTGRGYPGGPGGDEFPGSYPDTGSTGGSYVSSAPLDGPVGDDCGGCTSPTGPWNGGGGRGGRGQRGIDGAAGGGGGSYGSQGTAGDPAPVSPWAPGGAPGSTYGSEDLAVIYPGSGGGGGGKGKDGYGAYGGDGGGIIAVYAANLMVYGPIRADGEVGSSDAFGNGGGGGGGSGGSILLVVGSATLGTGAVTAVGGGGGTGDGPGNGAEGGIGGVGRIRIEYCDSLSGTTNPSASTQPLDCWIVEQIESAPYDSARLSLPESFTDGRHYWVQYGRRLLFSSAAGQTSTLRVPAATFSGATLEALVSDVGSASLTFRLDIGDDGSWDWETTQTVDGAATLSSPDLSAAFNQYWADHGAPSSGTLDVPVRVYLSRAGQVLLANLVMTPGGSTVRHVRLQAQDYASATLDLTAGASGSGLLTIAADVGEDGTVDWAWSGSPSYPVELTTSNLASAFNTYLSGRSGEIDVPVRFHLAPFLSLHLDDFDATPLAQADVTLTATDITFAVSDPTEGDLVPVDVTLHNDGTLDAHGVTAAFFAAAPGWGDWYIGSAYVPEVPAGGAAQTSILWNTLGFTGTVPVRVVLDLYGQLPESDDTNNEASTSYTILTRPDMQIVSIALSDDEPVVGETVTVTLTLTNGGQTWASGQTVALFDGNPSGGGASVGEEELAPLQGGGTATSTFLWTPTAPGPYRLFGQADGSDAVDEFDEGNNQTWRDVYVGFAGPLLLDSATAGDPEYTTAAGFGYVDDASDDVLATCGSGIGPEETLRRDPNGQVVYRFDHLLPGHFYHLDVTLYECDGAGRQESIYVDGTQIAGPEDLGDGEVHRLSLRLDPALYSDHLIIVSIEAPGIDGAVVGEINLYDIDYRYADAGGGQDPPYPGLQGCGWLDGVSSTAWGSLPYQSVRVDQSDGEVRYRFDGLDRSRRYNIHLTFWQPSGTARIQRVQIDGIDAGLTVNTGDYQAHYETVLVPATAYADDGSVIVSIVRINASTGAMVNEIALEEETLVRAGQCVVQETPYFTEAYGSVTINGQPAPVGTVVQALSPRGDTVGCFTVDSTGLYGFMRVYGEDASASPPIPGMRDGELVAFRVNGAPAVATPLLYWQDDHASHRVDLAAGGIEGQSILLSPGWNLFSFRVEPPVPSVAQVLSSIDGRYDRVLGEDGVYAPHLPDVYNTLGELHAGWGYYLRLTGSTSANALLEGITVPASTPIPLHAGWNWIGYLPQATLPVTVALQSIEGDYQRVLSLDRTYDPSLPEFSTLQQMEPGQGYLIYVDDDVTLSYPPDVGETAPSVPEAGRGRCTGVWPTPYMTLVYGQVEMNGSPAPIGARVEVMTPRGEVVGCFVVEQPGLLGLLHAYGEDTTAEPPIAGFRPGERLAFRVNGVLADSLFPIQWQDDRDPHHTSISVIVQNVFLPLIRREW